LIGYDPPPIDPEILKKMQEYKIDIEYARKCIEANKHNYITATYYLLLKKHIKGGGESIANAKSPNYDPNVFMKRIPNCKNLLAKFNQETEKNKGQKNMKNDQTINMNDL